MHLAQITLWRSFCKNSPSIQNFQSRLIKSMQKTAWKVKLLERIMTFPSIISQSMDTETAYFCNSSRKPRNYKRKQVKDISGFMQFFSIYATVWFQQLCYIQFFWKSGTKIWETRISEAKSCSPLKYMRTTSWEVEMESQLFLRKLLMQFVASHVLPPNLFQGCCGGMSWNIQHHTNL